MTRGSQTSGANYWSNFVVYEDTCWIQMAKYQSLIGLCVYFLENLPKEKGFNGKDSLANNDRYTRICSMLKYKEVQICMSFVIFLARDVSHFIFLLQTSAPMIHWLYSMYQELICNVIGKVVKEELLNLNGRPVSNAKMKEFDLLGEKNLPSKN